MHVPRPHVQDEVDTMDGSDGTVETFQGPVGMALEFDTVGGDSHHVGALGERGRLMGDVVEEGVCGHEAQGISLAALFERP